MQVSCKKDTGLASNDMDAVRLQIGTAAAMLRSSAALSPATAVPTMMYTLGNLTSALAGVAHRTTDVFTLTPDHKCSDFYRYLWTNAGLQLLGLLFALFAVLGGFLYQGRVAICSLLAVATVLSCENAHTIYHVREYPPEPTLTRGKVFFAGCVGTIALNLVLMMLLGTHDEQSMRARSSDGGWDSPSSANTANGKPVVAAGRPQQYVSA